MNAGRHKTRAKGYSIWLTPDKQAGRELVGIIASLSQHFGSPVFPPHVTLLGEIEDTRENILPGFKGLSISFTDLVLQPEAIEWQPVYFRALYYKIYESEDLMALNRKARELFGGQETVTFYPHLSLLYSLATAPEKQTALNEFKVPFPDPIKISHIELVKTQGKVNDWKLIERISLL